MTVFDGALDSQFTQYPKPQREAIYTFQRTYGALRVTKVQDTTGDIVIEALDHTPQHRVISALRVKPNGTRR